MPTVAFTQVSAIVTSDSAVDDAAVDTAAVGDAEVDGELADEALSPELPQPANNNAPAQTAEVAQRRMWRAALILIQDSRLFGRPHQRIGLIRRGPAGSESRAGTSRSSRKASVNR